MFDGVLVNVPYFLALVEIVVVEATMVKALFASLEISEKKQQQ